MGDPELIAAIECLVDDLTGVIPELEARQSDGNNVQTLKDALTVLLEIGAPIYVKVYNGI